jgi:hypothetical protein
MTRLFLAAGVAALAITAPAAARPGGGHGNNNDPQAYAPHGGGGKQRAQTVERRAPQRQAAAPQRMERLQRMERPQRMAIERQQPRMERQQMRVERMAQRPERVNRAQSRMADRQQVRANRAQAQNRMAERQQVRANRAQAQNRMAERQQGRANRVEQAQNRMAQRQELRANRMDNRVNARELRAGRMAGVNQGNGYGVGGCPPGLAGKGCMPPGQAAKQGLLTDRMALRADRIVNADAFRESRLAALTDRSRVIAPFQATRFIGQPLSAVSPLIALNSLPAGVSYLYPDTPDYYYQYGGGYLYQVDRGSSLISALLPLLAGGYMPGTYLPSGYMNSYAPSYYGLNSFYPASYGGSYGYGGGYDNLCNRYANGVVYRVDCMSGMIVDAIPTYAGGYGVGQMLPSAYSYYNVPSQYRSLYYDTPDYNYWYAPGAIYQYDRGSSLITSVAALLSPGFSVGQQMPLGYSTYNVPYAYRSTYYDTPDAWYRYNNGYIYQVDPTTQLVSAVVASILT